MIKLGVLCVAVVGFGFGVGGYMGQTNQFNGQAEVGTVIPTNQIESYIKQVPAKAWRGSVIHHTTDDWDMSAKRIDQIHRDERGWSGIGYHFVIRRNGDIEVGRSLMKDGAHAKGYRNKEFVGVALTGTDTFTKAQYESFINLSRAFFRKLFVQPGHIELDLHHEKCPGDGFDVDYVVERLKAEAVLAELDFQLNRDPNYRLDVIGEKRVNK